MSLVPVLSVAPPLERTDGFELVFVDAGGVQRCRSLTECWDVPLEKGRPVREFRWAKGQRHNPGWWWSATTGAHVGYESWLERDVVMMLDFDPKWWGSPHSRSDWHGMTDLANAGIARTTSLA